MNSEDNMIFNCGTFSTDGAQLVFENPNSERVQIGEAFEGKAENFQYKEGTNKFPEITKAIAEAMQAAFAHRPTDYAREMCGGDKLIAEK